MFCWGYKSCIVSAYSTCGLKNQIFLLQQNQFGTDRYFISSRKLGLCVWYSICNGICAYRRLVILLCVVFSSFNDVSNLLPYNSWYIYTKHLVRTDEMRPCNPQPIEAEWHICVWVNYTFIGLDNGLSLCSLQAILRTNVGLLLIGHTGINYGGVWIKVS